MKKFDELMSVSNEITNISVDEAREKLKDPNVQFIDVRELHEQPKIKNFNVIEIPLSVLENQLDLISRVEEKAIFCQSGIRSKTAVSILKKYHINNCYSIKEGASEIIGYINKSNKNVIHE